MIFSLDVRRARKGDCLLLHAGAGDKPWLGLIDGGPGDVYGPQLKPRLARIRKARGLGDNQPLTINLLMVSHVDDDHIHGILDLTREMLESPPARRPRVLSFWHNSFDDIVGKPPAELTAQFGAASTEAGLPEDTELDSDEPEEVVRSSLKVLASLSQGHRLRGDAATLKFSPALGGKLILASPKPVPVADGLTFTVAGPMQPELLALQKKHDEWLKTRKEDAEASLAAYVDKSVPNLSSIVVLAQAGGKKILLTGDARGDKILEGLELTGAMPAGGTLHVDILKVPHHGSSNNLDNDFFERIRADHYVMSGDGEHGNPERETMEMLFRARGGDPFELHLTYPVTKIDEGRKADWEKEQGKERARRERGSTKPLREDWSPAKHSLSAFFDGHPLAAGQKIRIVEDGQPHVIDLLDPLGY
jgi:hypothetical protein